MSAAVAVYHPLPGIGDLMWHLPYIRAIAKERADGKVVLLTRASTRAADLLGAESAVSQVRYIPYLSGPLRHPRELLLTYRALRVLQPRALWILDKISRPAIAARLLGIKHVYGFGLGSQTRWVTGATLPVRFDNAHPIEKLEAFAAANGLSIGSTEPALAVDSDLVAELRGRFADCPRPWVMLGVGAKNQTRRWPYAFFLELIDSGVCAGSFFVVGGPPEYDAVNRDLIAPSEHPDVVNASDLGMADIAALASACDAFVGNDSGPLNVAAAVGTEAIGLFGVTPALRYSKFLHPVTSPADKRSMSGISVEAVSTALKRLLVCDK